ncbi:MAG: serine protease [Pyrinomonadaceae bacterium]
MPPIPNYYLACSIYLYPSEQAARDGERFGGSGFLVSVPVEGHEGWGSLYAITNRHVLDEGCRFVRLNTSSGGIDILETERDSWLDHSDRYDVSVLSLDVEGRQLDYSSISIDKFITREIIDDYRICPGDDAFLVGRLVTPWGQQRNTPAVRFGNISMMADPTEPARGYGNVEQESFLVECRSLSGFSGSPVFVSTTRTYSADDHIPGGEQPKRPEPEEGGKGGMTVVGLVSTTGTFGPWLLGIDWGHLPLWKPVFEQDKETRTGHWVEQNTGIACVLPAWYIFDLLNEEELVRERRKDKEELDRRIRD